MGKMKSLITNKLGKISVNKKTDKSKLSLSVVSLILAAMVLVSATYCWYALSRAEGNASNVSLSVGNGLRVNDLGDAFQRISDNSYLLPASSVDGRNMFFPADGTDFSSSTSSMTFRSANAGDRNYDYVQLDFNLTAEANYTGIYLDKDTSLTIQVPSDATDAYKSQCETAQKAIRAAIYYEGMDAPIVFNGQSNPSSVDAVKDIDRTTGRFLESAKQVAVPFKDYSYGKRQLAMLNQGETRPFSLIIWLEGTDEKNCVSDSVMLKQLVLDLKFTTTWDNKSTIKFIDKDNAVQNILTDHPEYTLLLDYTHKYRDNNNKEQTVNSKFNMYKNSTDGSGDTWYCNIPDSAYSDLTFRIVNDTNGSTVYEWTKTTGGASTLNRGTSTTYYVDSVSGTDSRGHWYDGDIEEKGDGHDIGEIDDDDW